MLTRKQLYDLADPALPTARAEERQILIDLLAIEPHHVICDDPAWGGYLGEGLIGRVRDPKQIICVEPSVTFAAGINNAFTVHRAQQDQIPLADASVDRAASMVGLHHLPDKLGFIREMVRVLKPGGRIAFSEVSEDTAVARFLNGAVHRYATNGHRGMFVREGTCRQLLVDAGCTDIRETFHVLHWVFASETEMARFCYGLLGLSKATETQVLAAIHEYFAVEIVDGKVKLPWSLFYCVGSKC